MHATTATHIVGKHVSRLAVSAWKFRHFANHILQGARAGVRATLCTHLRMTVVPVVGLCALCLPGSSAVAGQPNSGVQFGSDFIIGISPFLDNSVKDEVYRSIVRLLVEDLPLNSTLAIYDAFQLKTITQVSLPNVRVFNSPKTRANHFAPIIREVKLFLAQAHVRPTNSHLNFDGAVRLPQFLDFLAEKLPPADSPFSVLLMGSPLYQDAKEPAFSMVDGYFPSDGHLRASREQSVFGFTGDAATVRPLSIQWMYFGDPWVNDLHKEKITRFWTLYLERRGARLAAFTGDLPTALESFRLAVGGPGASAKHWTADAEQTKIEMLRVSRG